jgi:multiple sugar transport system ATP-binding protein
MPSITLEHLTKVYDGGVIAVRDLDLHVEDGEFLVVVGASGSGKSTALRVIAGLERVTTGRVRIGQRDVTDVPPQLRDLAMVFQNYALYPHLTVRENLGFGLEMRKLPRSEIRRRVDDVAAVLGLVELLQRKPAALSGGQRQRVALGRAIVREPLAFLFDEPLSNLDARLRVQTRAELVRLHRQLGSTMVYVTHDQIEAMTMGQRIAVLHQGQLQQLATPIQLYDAPANRTVAAFIGSPPMNIFPGTAARAPNGVPCFRGRSFELALEREPPVSAIALGVRPEHLRIVSDGEHHDLAARVTAVEPLGSETLVYATTANGEDVAVRITGRADITVDDNLRLAIEPGRSHLFDEQSGARV